MRFHTNILVQLKTGSNRKGAFLCALCQMVGKGWYLNVNKKPFHSGTNYLSKWGRFYYFSL